MLTGLTEAGIEITMDEINVLMEKWDEDCSGDLTFDEFLKGLRGVLSEERQAVVDAAWGKFDVDGTGTITIEDLTAAGYNTDHHPKVLSGEITSEEVFAEFLQ